MRSMRRCVSAGPWFAASAARAAEVRDFGFGAFKLDHYPSAATTMVLIVLPAALAHHVQNSRNVSASVL